MLPPLEHRSQLWRSPTQADKKILMLVFAFVWQSCWREEIFVLSAGDSVKVTDPLAVATAALCSALSVALPQSRSCYRHSAAGLGEAV